MRRFNLIPMMLLAVLMLSSMIKAQSATESISESAVKNLVSGINSDNEGLYRSSIYLAGKYRVGEAVDALVTKMETEKDPGIRVLIALSLYEIRDASGLEAVRKQSLSDSSENVRNMSALIYSEFVKSSKSGYVSLNSKF
ncbi:MAG TPA: HEAT repeat domain-containing protein [Ignavibacteriaceae bacterium]|nr:HEAT repeat domain-containing protein [Ignavibacteriaceae bacterium]